MRPDPIELEVFKHLFHAVAEEMGAALRRTAFSPNIKERRDYSCALFDAAGNALAMGDHMPVHLGSMPMSVRAAIADLRLAPGDVAMLNDPFRGGTHLPDITVVAPVFVGRAQHKTGRPRRITVPQFFVAARAHHADVGGAYAGSMGPCREIYQEGLRIPPVKIVRAGAIDRDILALLLNNVRTPEEREGDLSAQLAACHTSSTRLIELCARYSLTRVQRAAHALLDYSEKMMRAFLATVPPGTYTAEDVLDDDGVRDEPVRIAVRITFPRAPKTGSRKNPRPVLVDFTGSSPQVEGSINAVEAITYSACFYVFRCLLRDDVPATAGLMRPIHVIAPTGTVVNARPPAAVAGGNVETSQRIVDVLLRALAQALPTQIPAASSGTMNNLTIGGMDDRRSTWRPGASNSSSVILSDEPGRPGDRTRSRRTPILPSHLRLAHASTERGVSGVEGPAVSPRTRPATPFAYYETIAGGSGASATHDGVSGVHTHMTNSLNTPAEALEYSYPLRVTKYALRRANSSPDGPIPHAGASPPTTRSSYALRGSQAVSLKRDPGLKSSPQGDISVAQGVSPGSYNIEAPESLQGRHASRTGRDPKHRNPKHRSASLSSRGGLQPDEGSAVPDNRQLTTDNFLPGAGKHRGGDGIIREIEVLTDATVTLLSDRRKSRPYGLAGGEPGAPGRTVIFRLDGSTELMPSKGSTRLQRGERIRIETPGGGGWGPPAQDGEDSSD